MNEWRVGGVVAYMKCRNHTPSPRAQDKLRGIEARISLHSGSSGPRGAGQGHALRARAASLASEAAVMEGACARIQGTADPTALYRAQLLTPTPSPCRPRL